MHEKVEPNGQPRITMPPPGKPIGRLVIDLYPPDASHQHLFVMVSGPVQDKPTCYAMLELARDVILTYCPEAVQEAPPGTIIH